MDTEKLIERIAQMEAASGLAKECLERATYLHAMEPEGLSTIERQSMETLYEAADRLQSQQAEIAALQAQVERLKDEQQAEVTCAGLEQAAWDWLDQMVSAICDEHPADIAYSADQMVDAYAAGVRHRQAAVQKARADALRLAENFYGMLEAHIANTGEELDPEAQARVEAWLLELNAIRSLTEREAKHD